MPCLTIESACLGTVGFTDQAMGRFWNQHNGRSKSSLRLWIHQSALVHQTEIHAASMMPRTRPPSIDDERSILATLNGFS
jgi:hypothetical protein